MSKVTAVGPATVANVFVGFDFLGFSIPDLADKVTVYDAPDNLTEIVEIKGSQGIPKVIDLNTAGKSIQYLNQKYNLNRAVKIEIDKGIPLSSGLGGSAASAVAATVAFNELTGGQFDMTTMLEASLVGEQVASGSIHADNVASCLYGGLVAALMDSEDRIEIINLPVPSNTSLVILHPDVQINTRDARKVISDSISLKNHVRQSMDLARFISSLYREDQSSLFRSLNDHIIERQRSHLIPYFKELKNLANKEGAVGFTISGAGPTMLGWFPSSSTAQDFISAIDDLVLPYSYQIWETTIDTNGAYVTIQEGSS